MQTGDILFIKGKGLISSAIRLVDGGEYTHVAIALTENTILEAQYFTRSRIIKNPYKEYDIIRLDLSGHDKCDILKLSVSLSGKWYDYKQIIGHLIKKPLNNPNNMICSELVGVLLYHLGYEKEMSLEHMASLTPHTLHQYLIAKGGKQICQNQ
ncbi:hypothetical protein EalM132_00093 [Exiguobacterium phage vB_EalM-132]|nr:hypothetical protein EalM132_00093 [Exiguobacterium phage vB_EalM-132]